MGDFFADRTVLVTGGAGFIGGHFVDALVRRGARVRVAVHRRPLRIAGARVETTRADLTHATDCLRVCDGVDCVVHAAGAVGSAAAESPQQMAAVTTNLVVTSQMLQAAWTAGVDRFLLLSSSTVYPAADHAVVEDEAWTAPPHASYAGYGWMKRSLERLAEFVASTSSVKVAVVRPTAVYGRRDESGHVIPALIRKALAGLDPLEVWGTGEEIRDFVHVTDVVGGALRALELHAVCDAVNLGSGRPSTIRDVARLILDAVGRGNARLRFDPSKPTNIPLRAVDISKARRLLGFEPRVPLEEGLADAVEWFRQQAPSRSPTGA